MIEKTFNALEAVIIACIISGALIIQFFLKEEPCPLCLIQRLGMLGVATSVLLNVRLKPQKLHYGLALICAIIGASVALRQISLHVCPDMPKFGNPVFGLSLYTWSFIIFGTSIVYNSLLLICFNNKTSTSKCNGFGHFACWFVIVIAFINVLGTLQVCGLGPCQ